MRVASPRARGDGAHEAQVNMLSRDMTDNLSITEERRVSVPQTCYIPRTVGTVPPVFYRDNCGAGRRSAEALSDVAKSRWGLWENVCARAVFFNKFRRR